MLCSNLSKKTLKAIGGPDIIADKAYYIAINITFDYRKVKVQKVLGPNFKGYRF